MEDLVRRWEEAERRLYPSMVAQPDLVARYIRMVRGMADDLRSVETVPELGDAWERRADLATAAAHREGMAGQAPDLELVAGAAFGLRYRELAAVARGKEVRRRIADARARGDEWVVLRETGVPEVPFPEPYHRLDMRLADGYGLRLSAALDAESGRPLYAVEGVLLDVETGGAIGEAEPPRRTFTDPGEWRGAVNALREGRPGRPV